MGRARVAGREPVPLFEELLEEFPEARWNVDTKSDAAVEPLVEAVRRADAWDRVCVGSFSEARLVRARALGGPRLASSLGTRGVAELRLLSRGGRAAERLLLAAARRRGAVCVQVPEQAYGIRVVDPRSSRRRTDWTCRCTCGRSTTKPGCAPCWTWAWTGS